MSWTEKKPNISGNLIIDGTIQGNQLADNTITSDKLAGSTEENYFTFNTGSTSGFFSNLAMYGTDFPRTNLGIDKMRHVSYKGNISLSTGTSSQRTGNIFIKLQVQVPEYEVKTFLGNAYQAQPLSGKQIVAVDGNIMNKLGVGQIGLETGSYRAVTGTSYDYNFTTSTELVTNGTFNTDTSGWTVENGTFVLATTGKLTQDSSGNNAKAYQKITISESGGYKFEYDRQGGNADTAKVYLSTSTSINDAIYESSVTGSNVDSPIVDLNISAGDIYIVFELDCDSAEFAFIDSISLKKYQPRTTITISTSPSAIVSTNTPVYHYPFAGASVGSWVTVSQFAKSVRTLPYGHNEPFEVSATIGECNVPLRCRLQVQHFISSTTASYSDVQTNMKSFLSGD